MLIIWSELLGDLNVMKQSNSVNSEVLIAELELHKTEYSTLREEIIFWLDAQKHYLNLTLVAVAAGLGFFPFIVEQKTFIILLFFPLVFHALLWEMLKSIKFTYDLSHYLIGTLIPRVNAILEQLGHERQDTPVLGWEVKVATRPVKISRLVFASISPTSHWVPILAIAALLIAYIFTVNNQGYQPSPFEILLIFLNLIFLVFAGIWNTVIARKAMQESAILGNTQTDASS